MKRKQWYWRNYEEYLFCKLCAVFTNKFVDPSKWFLFPFKDSFFCQFSGEVFKKLLMFKHLSRIMTKPTKWHVRPVWSESSLCALWVAKDCSSCKQQRLIRLGRCPGWSESSLGTHMLVLSRCNSIIIFICMGLVSMCLGLSDISGSKCMLRLKLWWFNVLWGALKKKCLINYYGLMCFSLSKVPCVSCVMLIWYFLLF